MNPKIYSCITDPSCKQDSWKLSEFFLIGEAQAVLPHRAQSTRQVSRFVRYICSIFTSIFFDFQFSKGVFIRVVYNMVLYHIVTVLEVMFLYHLVVFRWLDNQRDQLRLSDMLSLFKINPIYVIGVFLYPLKTSENQGYRKKLVE